MNQSRDTNAHNRNRPIKYWPQSKGRSTLPTQSSPNTHNNTISGHKILQSAGSLLGVQIGLVQISFPRQQRPSSGPQTSSIVSSDDTRFTS